MAHLFFIPYVSLSIVILVILLRHFYVIYILIIDVKNKYNTIIILSTLVNITKQIYWVCKTRVRILSDVTDVSIYFIRDGLSICW